MYTKTKLFISRGDLEHEFFERARESSAVAWDIETSGLDWRTNRIGTCQIATPDAVNVVVLDPSTTPKMALEVLESDGIHKVFHHAPFDLRFMMHAWSARPSNVGCTKIASKILDPNLASEEHSLRPVLRRHLGVSISKDEQVSDWLADDLTDAQLEYAATDVAYLLDLEAHLLAQCRHASVDGLVRESWQYLPTRAMLDLRGSGDVFTY